MTEIDVRDVYDVAHGRQVDMESRRGDPFRCVDTTDMWFAKDVSRKLMDVEHSLENLVQTVRSSGDCVRFAFGAGRRTSHGVSYDLWSVAALVAAIYDGIANGEDDRSVYLKSDARCKGVADDAVVASMSGAYDVDAYAREFARNLS